MPADRRTFLLLKEATLCSCKYSCYRSRMSVVKVIFQVLPQELEAKSSTASDCSVPQILTRKMFENLCHLCRTKGNINDLFQSLLELLVASFHDT